MVSSPCAPLAPVTLPGRWCRVEPLAADHLPQLYDALVQRPPERACGPTWRSGPSTDPAGLTAWLRSLHDDPGSFRT